MEIDWATLGLQAVNVLVLIWLLKRFLYAPVTKILAERQAAASAQLDAAETARHEAEAARDAAKAQEAGLAAERAARLAAIAEEGKRREAVLTAQAEAEAKALREAGQAQLARERQAEEALLSEKATTLAVDIARKLLSRMPDETLVSAFIADLAQAVSALPEATRADFGRDGPVSLTAPRALSEAETAQLAQALDVALGHAVTLETTVDPALIAGLELRDRHAVVRNHFRADLSRIAEELKRHDG